MRRIPSKWLNIKLSPVSAILVFRCLAAKKRSSRHPKMWTTSCPRFRGRWTPDDPKTHRRGLHALQVCNVEGCKQRSMRQPSRQRLFFFEAWRWEAFRRDAACRVLGRRARITHPALMLLTVGRISVLTEAFTPEGDESVSSRTLASYWKYG